MFFVTPSFVLAQSSDRLKSVYLYIFIYVDLQEKHSHVNVSTEVFISNTLQIKWSLHIQNQYNRINTIDMVK